MKRLLPITVAFIAGLAPLAAQAGRALTPEDWYRFQALSDLKIAPDGAAIAYLVTSYDKESDESRSALWLATGRGTPSVQLTRGESVSEPRFSPDGRYLSFLSARPAEGKASCGCSIGAAVSRDNSLTSPGSSATTNGRPTASTSCS